MPSETDGGRRRSLPWAGFAPLRPGRIHVYCPRCGRKQSNAPRQEYDPPRATLVHTGCERCSQGGKDSYEVFYTATGRRISGEEMDRVVDRVIRAKQRQEAVELAQEIRDSPCSMGIEDIDRLIELQDVAIAALDAARREGTALLETQLDYIVSCQDDKTKNPGDELLDTRRERDELRATLAQQQARIAALEQERDAAKETIRGLREALTVAERALAELEHRGMKFDPPAGPIAFNARMRAEAARKEQP